MSVPTNRIREWRQQKGLTLQALAEASGTTKAQIDKLEKGERRLTVEWMVRLAKALACDPRDLLPHEILPPPSSKSALPTLPIRGASNGAAQTLVYTESAVDQTDRPTDLAHVAEAYALYVVGSSMSPMYRPGQLLYINPTKPPKTGSGIAVILKNKTILIREWVDQTPEKLAVRTYHPQSAETEIQATDILAIHTVVGAKEPN